MQKLCIWTFFSAISVQVYVVEFRMTGVRMGWWVPRGVISEQFCPAIFADGVIPTLFALLGDTHSVSKLFSCGSSSWNQLLGINPFQNKELNGGLARVFNTPQNFPKHLTACLGLSNATRTSKGSQVISRNSFEQRDLKRQLWTLKT